MAQGPSDTILAAIWITLRIRESKVRNPDPPDRQRFVLSEHRFLVDIVIATTDIFICLYNQQTLRFDPSDTRVDTLANLAFCYKVMPADQIV